jgi:hypothetical protein
MQVWQWLNVPEWNLEAGELVMGAEVTVGGEKAGQEKAPDAYWAKIASKSERDAGDPEDIYIVEDAAGRQGWARRSSLRPLFEAQVITRLFIFLPALGQRGAALQELQVPALVIEANERHGLYFGDVGLRSRGIPTLSGKTFILAY